MAGKLRELVKAHAEEDAATLAATIFRELPEDEIVGLVRDAIMQERRNITRDRESAAFAQLLTRGLGTQNASLRPADGPLRGLLASRFALDETGKNMVTWGAATVAHHRLRIAMLEDQRARLEATIARHRIAIAMLEESGATCLNDMDAEAAA